MNILERERAVSEHTAGTIHFLSTAQRIYTFFLNFCITQNIKREISQNRIYGKNQQDATM